MALAGYVKRCADGPTQHVPCYQRAGWLDALGLMTERPDHYGHGGDAVLFQDSCGVSNGHVADRSSADQHHRVYVLLIKPLGPFGRAFGKQPFLGRRANEGVIFLGKLSQYALGPELLQAVYWEDNVIVRQRAPDVVSGVSNANLLRLDISRNHGQHRRLAQELLDSRYGLLLGRAVWSHRIVPIDKEAASGDKRDAAFG